MKVARNIQSLHLKWNLIFTKKINSFFSSIVFGEFSHYGNKTKIK